MAFIFFKEEKIYFMSYAKLFKLVLSIIVAEKAALTGIHLSKWKGLDRGKSITDEEKSLLMTRGEFSSNE